MSSSMILSAAFDEDCDRDDALQTPKTAPLGSACIAAVIEGRGSASEVGFAAYNLDTSECTVTQLGDTSGYSRTLTILHVHQPSQIIICSPEDAVQHRSKLLLMLQEEHRDEQLLPWPRRMFSDTAGMQLMQSLCLPDLLPSLLLSLANKFGHPANLPHHV